MDKFFTFTLNELIAGEQETQIQVSELNKILQGAGVTVKLDGSYLKFYADMKVNKKKMTRNAGRNKDFRKDKRYKLQPTIRDIKKMRETMTHAEIIEKIGCPRATYYRAWKALQEMQDIEEFENSPFFML